MCLGLTSCYNDKGGNDFETEMPDVVMLLPKSTYSVMKGMTLNIQPIIESEIDESDLAYVWQVCGDAYNKNGRKYFMDIAEGKELNWVGDFNETITELNSTYQIRLMAEQKSTGRKFYSNQSKFTLAGMNGLLLLYGNDESSEMALLKANEFTPQNSELPEEPSVVSGIFEAKTNKKLIGKGIQVGQVIIQYIEYYGAEQKAKCRVFVLTDKDGAWLDKDELTYYGDWSSYFRAPEELTQPKGVRFVGQAQIAYDGDNMYVATFDYAFPWGSAEITPETDCLGNNYIFAPEIEQAVGYNSFQSMSYATSINGDPSHKGFVGFGTSYYSGNGDYRNYAMLVDTKDDVVPFNPSDMHADVVKMKFHSDDCLFAVLKGDNTHPLYSGKYFLAELLPNNESAGESGYAGIPQNLYDLDGCEEIQNATYFALGKNSSQCYYATNNSIYQFVASEGVVRGNRKLTNNKGEEIEIHGEITCMKYLDESLAKTHNTEPILVVCTMDAGKARMYAMHITEMTGTVKSFEIYDSSTIQDWDIVDPIRDFGMKTL